MKFKTEKWIFLIRRLQLNVPLASTFEVLVVKAQANSIDFERLETVLILYIYGLYTFVRL